MAPGLQNLRWLCVIQVKVDCPMVVILNLSTARLSWIVARIFKKALQLTTATFEVSLSVAIKSLREGILRLLTAVLSRRYTSKTVPNGSFCERTLFDGRHWPFVTVDR